MKNITKTVKSGNIGKENAEKYLSFGLLMVFAFIVHIIFAAAYVGFDVDMGCFSWWADAVYEHGFGQFYHLEAFTDYPPGYMYVLYIIGALRKLTGLTDLSTAAVIMLKMPAILCDLGIGCVIYKVASKYTTNVYSLLFAAAYMFNPAIIINSCTWGQVDSVFTLFVVLMCYFVTEKKLPYAYFVFAIGILMKPQTMMFAPVLILGIIDQVFLNDFSWKRMFRELAIGLSAIVLMVLLVLPYGFEEVISQYVDTLASYPYASVNAYNMWTLFGFNWHSQDDLFLFLSFKNWGTVFIILAVVCSAIYCMKNKESESKYYLTGALLITFVFMTSSRMHDRYMYPALALLLTGAVVKRQKGYFIAYAALTIAHFCNVYDVLFNYDAQSYDASNPALFIISGISILAFALFVYVLVDGFDVPRALTYAEKIELELKNKIAGNKNKAKRQNNNGNYGKNNTTGKGNINNANVSVPDSMLKRLIGIRSSVVSSKWTKWDFIIMFAITAVYACIAFYNLGDMRAPESFWKSETIDSEIVLDFGEETQFKEMYNYLGYYENRKFEVSISNDGTQWQPLSLGTASEDENNNPDWMNICSVFCWNQQAFSYNTRYIKFVSKDERSTVMEMMFYDSEGNVVTPVNTSDYPELFDEQDIFDGKMTFMNSTYFDEIYHARTAYEMVNGLYVYETTHPPLGKAIMSIGVLLFGMCPFGWRFMGTLIGVLMVPVMYLLGRKLTDKTWLASVFTLLFTFDFMHFAQTRIATIDVYVTFFIMLSYFFMLCYYKMSFNDTALKKTYIPLALSGICMGLGCASKWTGVYAGIGLGLVFALVMVRRYCEYSIAKSDPKGESEGISHQSIIDNYSINTLKTLAFCVIAFVVVPCIIYLCAYIPFNNGYPTREFNTGLVARMFDNQSYMYDYHSQLVATHPYESTWYQWPVMTRPILYYVENVSDTLRSGISSFGNPFVWWAGIPAFIYMLYLSVCKIDRNAMFLAIGYLAQYIPWMFVSRCTFIYHYFPSVPFVVMMIGYSIYTLTRNKAKWTKIPVAVYVIAVIALFVAFYPVLSGFPATNEYANYLKWFDDWVLLF